MSRKPKTLDEIEREADLAEDAPTPVSPDPEGQRPADFPEIYDHIFSVDEASNIKLCLDQIARDRESMAGEPVSKGWQAILNEAHAYEYRSNLLRRKARVGREIQKLAKKGYGQDSWPIRFVRGAGFDRKRPMGGAGDRDVYIEAVCEVYKKVSGKRVRISKTGPLMKLLQACLTATIFREKNAVHTSKRWGRVKVTEIGPVMKADSIISAVKRILGRT